MREALGLQNRHMTRDNTLSASIGKLALPSPHSSDGSPRRRPSRRFVRDGEIPVTVIRGRWSHASGADEPVANRVAIAEAALESERLRRERIERSLQEALDTIRDLRTKQAHVELARNEAVQLLKRNAEALESLHAALRTHQEQLAGAQAAAKAHVEALRECNAVLTAERGARMKAESALLEATSIRKPRRTRAQASRRVAAKPMRRRASGSPIVSRRAKASNKRRVTGKAARNHIAASAKTKLTRTVISKKRPTRVRKSTSQSTKRRKSK